MVATRVETAAHQPADRFSIMPILNRKKKMCQELKVIVLGKAGVGKSSLLASLTDSNAEKPSGLDFRVKMASLNDEIVKLQLWDTADQEKHGAAMLPKSYYRRARGVFLVYDASDRQSFRDVAHWVIQLQTFRDESEPLSVVLVANKSRPGHSAVSSMQGQAVATLLEASFVEYTSTDGPTACLRQLISDLSTKTKPWNADLGDLAARLEAIESLSLVGKTQLLEDTESDTETESESEESEVELDDASSPASEPTELVLPSVDKIAARRDSRLFAALELGEVASIAAVQLISPRALARAALVASGVLLCASPLALLVLNNNSEPLGGGVLADGALGLVRGLAWAVSRVQ